MHHIKINLKGLANNKKNVLILLSIIIVIFSSPFSMLCFINVHNVCDSSFIKRFNTLKSSSNLSELRDSLNKLQKSKNFDKDYNCVYIALTYSISTNDYQSAVKYLDILSDANDLGYSKDFVPKPGSLDLLKNDVDALYRANKAIDDRSDDFINNFSDFVKQVEGN